MVVVVVAAEVEESITKTSTAAVDGEVVDEVVVDAVVEEEEIRANSIEAGTTMPVVPLTS